MASVMSLLTRRQADRTALIFGIGAFIQLFVTTFTSPGGSKRDVETSTMYHNAVTIATSLRCGAAGEGTRLLALGILLFLWSHRNYVTGRDAGWIRIQVSHAFFYEIGSDAI